MATGDVQVSVVWDAPTDIDLRVTDPMNEEIYFGNRSSASLARLSAESAPSSLVPVPGDGAIEVEPFEGKRLPKQISSGRSAGS